MAARRLIMILLVVLLLSSLAAALVPIERSSQSDESSSTTTTTEPARRDSGGRLLSRRVGSGGRATIRMRLGDQLQLAVTARRPDQVEIPALDQVEPVDLGAPASFDLLPDQVRSYAVRLVGANRTIAKIEVAAPERSKRRANGSGNDR